LKMPTPCACFGRTYDGDKILMTMWVVTGLLSMATPPLIYNVASTIQYNANYEGGDDDGNDDHDDGGDNSQDGGSRDNWFGGPGAIKNVAMNGIAYVFSSIMFLSLVTYGALVLKKEMKLGNSPIFQYSMKNSAARLPGTPTSSNITSDYVDLADGKNGFESNRSGANMFDLRTEKKASMKLGMLRGALLMFGGFSFIVGILVAIGREGGPDEMMEMSVLFIVPIQFFVWTIHCIVFSIVFAFYKHKRVPKEELHIANLKSVHSEEAANSLV